MIWASDKSFQELEEVPMTMIGGLDVHRQQITFDYPDSDGPVRRGQIRPATPKTSRGRLAEHYPDNDAEFALLHRVAVCRGRVARCRIRGASG